MASWGWKGQRRGRRRLEDIKADARARREAKCSNREFRKLHGLTVAQDRAVSQLLRDHWSGASFWTVEKCVAEAKAGR